jgi:hypothetical protein
MLMLILKTAVEIVKIVQDVEIGAKNEPLSI